MRQKLRPFVLFIFFVSFIIPIAVADNVNSANVANNSSQGLIFIPIYDVSVQPTLDYPEANSGFDSAVSFWELPAWIQLAYLGIIATGILALLKVLPLVWGRLRTAFENPKTKEIFYVIQNKPGLTIKELSEEQNINRGTLKCHLSQLFANNKITLIRKGKVSQLYHNTMSPMMDKESIIASYLRRNDNSKSILFSIMDNPGVTNKDLSEKFNLDKSTITDYIKKFNDDDIVEFRQDGKFKRCYVKHDARMILLRYKPQ